MGDNIMCLDCPGTQSESAGKVSACHGCPNQSVCASGATKGPDLGELLSFYSQKYFKCLHNIDFQIFYHLPIQNQNFIGQMGFWYCLLLNAIFTTAFLNFRMVIWDNVIP